MARIEIENLTKEFGTLTALDNVVLELEKGQNEWQRKDYTDQDNERSSYADSRDGFDQWDKSGDRDQKDSGLSSGQEFPAGIHDNRAAHRTVSGFFR